MQEQVGKNGRCQRFAIPIFLLPHIDNFSTPGNFVVTQLGITISLNTDHDKGQVVVLRRIAGEQFNLIQYLPQ